MFLLIVLVAVAAAAAQELPPPQCGCAPQPVVIQLSCNGNTQPAHPPPEHFEPAPPPAFEHPAPPPPFEEPLFPPAPPPAGAPQEEPLDYTAEDICHFDQNGLPTTNPPGGWPCGFMVHDFGNNGQLNPNVAYQDWHYNHDGRWYYPAWAYDGTPETLGFPMPPKGTAQYNMIMCWPKGTNSIWHQKHVPYMNCEENQGEHQGFGRRSVTTRN